MDRAREHTDRIAVISDGSRFTYSDLLAASARVAACLLDGACDLREARVAHLAPSGFTYAAVQWGIWQAGGVAVPLSVSHPVPEIEYVIDNSQSSILVAAPGFESTLSPIAVARNARFVTAGEALAAAPGQLASISPERPAMILFTSGTTSRPKGAVLTHRNIEAQVRTLVSAWEWQREDHALHVLPLHHVHGIINVLTCALWSGATCEMLPRFDAEWVWDRIASGEITVFMAVPTIYAKLVAAWDRAAPARRIELSEACSKVRLMVSGSAALPASVFEKWKSISGHALLERYGMTEIGMALSNPLRGERRAGFVGSPLPGVDVRIVDDKGSPVSWGTPGEIEVRSPSVFREYWGNPQATSDAFRDDWFRTGDVAVVEEGSYRILGRSSVDIIKTGGYKVSALEIEEILRTHPAIAECAVVGIEDDEWGERVCAALVAIPSLTLEDLRLWARDRVAPYKVPSRMLLLDELPRNALGKVIKQRIRLLFPLLRND